MMCRRCNKNPIAILGRCESCHKSLEEKKTVRLEHFPEDVRKILEDAMADGGDVPI